jgi:RNA polymerase sigma-70 factor (ECF subfamily)
LPSQKIFLFAKHLSWKDTREAALQSIDPAQSETTLAELYQLYRPGILARLARIVGDADTAEDLYQETFVKAVRAWATRNPQGNAAAWLYRIATNTAYDFLRRQGRVHFVALSCDQPAPQTDTIAEGSPVRAALAQIPAGYRALLVLHACEGHSLDEIAAQLGCTNAAVKSRLFRARACFRQAYDSSAVGM